MRGLRERGFALSKKSLMWQTTEDLDIAVRLVIPLERTDGGKMHKDDPAGLMIGFCPWCGQRLN